MVISLSNKIISNDDIQFFISSVLIHLNTLAGLHNAIEEAIVLSVTPQMYTGLALG